MTHALLIFLGGGAGAVCRHYVGLVGLKLMGPGFPWGTLAVNVIGSCLMGLFIAWLMARGGPTSLRLLVATGFLGGFTTFSAFSLDTLNLWERGHSGLAISYVAASVALSIAAVVVGMAIGRALTTSIG